MSKQSYVTGIIFLVVMASILGACFVQISRISGAEINRECRIKCAPYSWNVGTVGFLGKELVCSCNKLREIR